MLDRAIKNEINSFSLEMKLMFLLSVKEIDEEKVCVIQKILEQNLDWDLFLNIAQYNRTYPIVYKNISKLINLRIPEPVFNKLEQSYKGNTLHVLKFAGELIRLMDLMKKNEVRAISLKGPLLGIEIYGDVSLRTSRDLDILIDCNDLEKVEKIL